MKKSKWSTSDIPDQSGKTAIVTGANTGIGFEMAKALAAKGAHVVLACRNRERGRAALEKIKAEQPAGKLELAELDLSSLESVRKFAADFTKKHKQLDILINNAGVMMPPFSKTADGFELQFGVNFIGHFTLTGLLAPRWQRTKDARIVTLSSIAHRIGKIDFDSFQGETKYSKNRSYAQSKLADLMFALELDRRLKTKGSTAASVAAHPGVAVTELQRHTRGFTTIGKLFGQNAYRGALPTLYAATMPDVEGGQYWGPDGFQELKGYPRQAKIFKQALEQETAKKLWEYAEEATGVKYPG